MFGGAPAASKPGFVDHVFTFDAKSKAIAFNTIQYALLAIVPVVCWNKLMQRFVPDSDEKKSTLEISFEVIAQVVAMFTGIIFIHRIITYPRTYSEVQYSSFNPVNVVLAMLVIVLSLKTKVGDKVSILANRVVDAWEGVDHNAPAKKKKASGPPQATAPRDSLPPTEIIPSKADETQSYYQQSPIDHAGVNAAALSLDDGPAAANDLGVNF
jgi:hypothetical protein